MSRPLLSLAPPWATVLAFLLFGPAWLTDLQSPALAGALFVWLLVAIVISAFAVVHEAEELAHLLGEPFGTLILTLSIVIIEVALISAVMLGANVPTLARDTMYSVLMIVLNGVVGIGLLIGGFRHHEQEYNLQGAAAYLAILIPLSLIALVLPNFTTSTGGGTLNAMQAVAFSAFTILLYGLFLFLQTGRHRGFFIGPHLGEETHIAGTDALPPSRAAAPAQLARHFVLLVANILPIVILAKSLAKVLDYGLDAIGAPVALGGILIAMIVFTPEGISAIRAIMADELQRAVNLCLGATASTIGLTVPAVLLLSVTTGKEVTLGLSPTHMVLLAMTLFVSTITFQNVRTTMLEGAVHLTIFLVFLVLVFSP